MTWTTFDRCLEWVDQKLGTLQAGVWTLLGAAFWVWLETVCLPTPRSTFLVLTFWEGLCIVCAMIIQTWIADEKAERVARILLRGTS